MFFFFFLLYRSKVTFPFSCGILYNGSKSSFFFTRLFRLFTPAHIFFSNFSFCFCIFRSEKLVAAGTSHFAHLSEHTRGGWWRLEGVVMVWLFFLILLLLLLLQVVLLIWTPSVRPNTNQIRRCRRCRWNEGCCEEHARNAWWELRRIKQHLSGARVLWQWWFAWTSWMRNYNSMMPGSSSVQSFDLYSYIYPCYNLSF